MTRLGSTASSVITNRKNRNNACYSGGLRKHYKGCYDQIGVYRAKCKMNNINPIYKCNGAFIMLLLEVS